MFQMNVPKPFWSDAISTACFLINRLPSSILNGNIPFSTIFPSKPLFHLDPKIFGCVCFVRDVRPTISKLDPKALKCIFFWVHEGSKGIYLFFSYSQSLFGIF